MKKRHALSLGALAALAVATANITVANATEPDDHRHGGSGCAGCKGCKGDQGCHGDDEAGN